MTTPAPDENKTLRVFLIRGVIAIAWAAVFVAAAGSLTTNVTVVAGVLLVLYPLIDAVATLIDARSQRGSARQWLLINAGSSILAAVALGVAKEENGVMLSRSRSTPHKRSVVLPASNVLGWRRRRGKGEPRWQRPRSRPIPTQLS